MGCAFTKNDGNSGGDTNKDVNSQNQKGPPGAGGGQPEQPQADPRLPLNTRQKFNISKSWKGIVRAMEPTGVNMFVK